MSDFRFTALEGEAFGPLFDLDDASLELQGMRRLIAGYRPGFPCRVSLDDAEPGEEVLALTYTHHDVDSPYRASGPIFVRRGVNAAAPAVNEIPAMFGHRPQSVRAYDDQAMMVAAVVAAPGELEPAIRSLFQRDEVRYLHLHNAGPGCFNCQVERA